MKDIACNKKESLRRLLGLYALFAPFGILIFVFSYIPMYGIIIAFKDFTPYEGVFGSMWVGLKHFIYFLTDEKFWQVMRNTVIINVYDLLFGFTAPIIFALLMNEVCNKSFKRIIQTISYLPHFLSWVVVAGIFIQILSPSEGLVNKLFTGVFGMEPVNFMSESRYFRSVVVTANIWKGVGWGAILYFATIAGIDENLYEAAYIDGASRLRMIWHITLPGMASIMVLMLLLTLASIFNIGFERIFLMQNALVQDVSDVISVYVYRLGLKEAQYSLSSAIGLMQSVLGFFMLIGANRISKKIAGLGLY